MSQALADALQHPAIGRHPTPSMARFRSVSTGLAELDARIPGGGWPLGALSEVLFEQDSPGELRLLMPALAQLTGSRRRVVLVNPPYMPYAPALTAAGVDLRFLSELQAPADEAAWSIEQCVRSGCCGAVVGWLPEVDYRTLRRLHLAAESNDALAVIYRPARQHLAQTSPAALRLHVPAMSAGSNVDVIKARSHTHAAHRSSASMMH